MFPLVVYTLYQPASSVHLASRECWQSTLRYVHPADGLSTNPGATMTGANHHVGAVEEMMCVRVCGCYRGGIVVTADVFTI